MRKRSLPHVIFSLFYRSAYTLAALLLLGLLAVTPADQIYQTVYNKRFGNAIVVGCVLSVTSLLTLFIYASRLYTNRVTLAAIPKPYLPIEPGEIPKRVRKELVRGRQRAALIAWETRPRDLTGETHATQRVHEKSGRHIEQQNNGKEGPRPYMQRFDLRRIHQLYKGPSSPLTPYSIVNIDCEHPPWGPISHPGWSSKSLSSTAVPDNPTAAAVFDGVNFDTVIAELPHLIEAKAVTLAPSDPSFGFMKDPSDTPRTQTLRSPTPSIPRGSDVLNLPPDPKIVALLQRPKPMGLRSYLARLQDFEIVTSEVSDNFLESYECARFRVSAVSEREFESLMEHFARLLESMDGVNIGLLGDLLYEYLEEQENGGDASDRGYESESESEEEDLESTGSVKRLQDPEQPSLISVNSSAASASSVVVHRSDRP